MNLNQFGQYWSASPAELQYSPLMQTIPTAATIPQCTDQTCITTPTLFRPYNHYPLMGINTNRLDRSYKSAFKPVSRRVLSPNDQPEVPLKRYTCEVTYSGLPTMTTVTSSMSANFTNYQPVTTLIPSSARVSARVSPSEIPKIVQNTLPTHDNGGKSSNVPMNQHRSNIPDHCAHTPSAQGQQNSNVENVFQWDTLLPLVPESAKRIRLMMPPKKSYTRKRCQKNDTKQVVDANVPDVPNVPVIDLTSNDEIDDIEERIPQSVIEPNKPLDLNGNEILISTNTKTMESVSYMKPKELEKLLKAPSDDKTTPHPVDVPQSKSSPIPPVAPITEPILLQNGQPMPAQEKTEFISKYNHCMQHFRASGGFRLFAQRNHWKAKSYTLNGNGDDLIHNTLMKWWISMSPCAREQYAQIANSMTLKRAQMAQHLPKSVADDINVSASILQSFLNTSKVANAGDAENMNKISTNDVITTSLHTQHLRNHRERSRHLRNSQ